MSFFEELKRRNVFRVGIAYVISAWILMQFVDLVLENVNAPDWVMQVFMLALAIGFPLAVFFAWAFEMTPEGIKKEKNVDHNQSISPQTGRKLDRSIIIVLVIALAYFGYDKFSGQGPEKGSGSISHDASQSTETAVDGNTNLTPAQSQTPKRKTSVAVLPFVNLSSEADNQYFSDGVAEEILNQLAAIPDLEVAARTSSFHFRGEEHEIAEIAAALGVTHILEGSVRKSGNRVRITAQLITADNGFHLWSKNFDRTLDDIFAVQDEIAANIAGVLEVKLLGRTAGVTQVQDLEPVIYEKFLKARYLLRRRNELSMLEAVVLNEAVVEAYPDFPRGLIQLAESRHLTVRFHADEKAALIKKQIRQNTQKALKLDPNLAAGYMLKGQLAAGEDLNKIEAIKAFQKAIELDAAEPTPHHWLGIQLSIMGYLKEARQELQIAIDLEPDNANANGYLGLLMTIMGQPEEALSYFREQTRLGHSVGDIQTARVLIGQGDFEAARKLLAGIDTDSFGYTTKRIDLLLAAAANPERTKAYIQYFTAHPENPYSYLTDIMTILNNFDWVLQYLGENPQPFLDAFWWLENAAQTRASPEFIALLKGKGIIDYWDQYGPPPQCRKVDETYDCS